MQHTLAGWRSSIKGLDKGTVGPHREALVGRQLGARVDGAEGAGLGSAGGAVVRGEGDGVIGCGCGGEEEQAGEPGGGRGGTHVWRWSRWIAGFLIGTKRLSL